MDSNRSQVREERAGEGRETQFVFNKCTGGRIVGIGNQTCVCFGGTSEVLRAYVLRAHSLLMRIERVLNCMLASALPAVLGSGS